MFGSEKSKYFLIVLIVKIQVIGRISSVVSRNNGRRGRGRGRGRGAAHRGRNRQNVAAPPEELDFGMSDASSESDDDVDLFTGLALIEVLKKMRSRPERYSHFSEDPGCGSEERITYTEDDIPINTIYANFSMCPEVATETNVRTLFEQFGPIKSVRIHTNQNNNTYDEGEMNGGGSRGRSRYNRIERVIRYGFISYERCEDAFK